MGTAAPSPPLPREPRSDRGAREVVLFTDVANRTSNDLYRRLGYVPVEDRLTVRFGEP